MNETIVKRERMDRSNLAGGIILIVVGVMFLLSTLDVADFGDVISRYWPMIVVLVGIPKLFSRETVWSGMWLITVGVWLQISHLELWGLSYGTSWPLLLIGLGGGMIVRALIDPSPKREHGNER